MAESYDAMRCNYLDAQVQWHQHKIAIFITKVKKKIMNKESSRQASDKAMHQALTYLQTEVPDLSDEEDPDDLSKMDIASLEQLKSEMKKMQEDLAKLKIEQECLKQDNKQLAKALQKEKSKSAKKHEKLDTKLEEMETNHLLCLNTVEKNLSKVQNFIKRNSKGYATVNAQKLAQGNEGVNAAKQSNSKENSGLDTSKQKQAQKDSPKSISSVDLVAKNASRIHVQGDVTDFVVTDDGCVITAEQTDEYSCLKLFDAQDTLLTTNKGLGWKGRIKLAVLSMLDTKLLVVSGRKIQLYRWDTVHHKNWLYDARTIYEDDSFYIDAIAPLNSSTFAAAAHFNINLMNEDGTIYRVLESKNQAIDMCATLDGALVLCDSYTVWKLDHQTGSTIFKGDSRTMKCPNSIAEWNQGYVFFCDTEENSLSLIGPRGKENLVKWPVSQIKDGDELQHVFVHENQCRCLTKLGIMLTFEIQY